ncbi:hypothetical protein L207DRAFT_519163 [Hyaloscypha variabilis F]|uniref:2EXR domain-containing protein n=1 Tax=Hyaloscypha variabilis (strain UAMH 11265 / GT02V1 / F) TaxID=1149755 RepID=A0A2J6QZY0_HYAVF|nr:hypothetical protein L207DRAFT_519163 [Hyaloscypha variabilis F]
MSLDSFPLFPLLPIEIRLQIWKLTFPKARRIEPWTWHGPNRLNEPPFTRSRHNSDYRGPGFSCGKTDPVALWINRESRHEALKHYTARDYNQLKRLVRRDNVRYEAYIDYAMETIAFNGKHHEITSNPCTFFSKSEMGNVIHLEIGTFVDVLASELARSLDEKIRSFPNLEDIFVHVKCSHLEDDTWEFWYEGPNNKSFGSVSAVLLEARQIGEQVFQDYEVERREPGDTWKAPLLLFRPCLGDERPRFAVEKVRRLVDEARSAAEDSSLSEPTREQ